jgi:hypothetical protein
MNMAQDSQKTVFPNYKTTLKKKCVAKQTSGDTISFPMPKSMIWHVIAVFV